MLLTDVRYALRALSARPGFTFLVTLTLALGIGANTAMFSAVYHTLIRPLPFENGSRLVEVRQNSDAGMMIPPSGDQFLAWKGKTRHFEAIEQVDNAEFIVLGESEPQLVGGARISRGFLPMLKLSPIVGRNFTEDEMKAGAPNVALISESFWKMHFGGRADISGLTLRLSDGPHLVVGVVPNSLAMIDNFGQRAKIWVPLRPPPATETVSHSFHGVIAILREGSTAAQAQQELSVLSSGVKQSLSGKWSVAVNTSRDMLDSGTRKAMPVLFAAVGMVLLIACANVAGLLLVRLNNRRRELAVRAALGAGRLNIIRHVWVEALVLAALGTLAGVLLASWGIDLVKAMAPEEIKTLAAMQINGPALLFACGLAFITSLVFAAAPIVHLVRANLVAPLAAGGGAGSRVTENRTLRSVMVVGQIAVSLVLLIGATLLIRSVQNLQDQPLGFEPARVLRAEITLPQNRYATDEARRAFLRDLEQRVEKIPGVELAALGSGVPTQMGMFLGDYRPENPNTPAQNMMMGAVVDADYFKLLGVRLVEGRLWADEREENVAVINRHLANQFWPGESAIGKRLRSNPDAPWTTVVGVIDDFAAGGLRTTKQFTQMYSPVIFGWNQTNLVVRTRNADPLSILSQLRQTVRALDPELPLRDVTTLDAMLANTIARDRFNMALLTMFALLAFVLSLVGLYGVISQTVTRRTNEIGVRMALGATAASVRSMVLREGAVLTAIGLISGALGAFVAVQVMTALLHGVAPRDPLSFVFAALLLAAGGILACWLPAHRATRIDPLEALRAE